MQLCRADSCSWEDDGDAPRQASAVGPASSYSDRGSARSARSTHLSTSSNACAVLICLLPSYYQDRMKKRQEKDDGIKRKMPETRPNQKESLPNFAKVISMELVSYPEKFMSQFELKLREFQITCKNAVFLPKTSLVRFFVLVLIQSNSHME